MVEETLVGPRSIAIESDVNDVIEKSVEGRVGNGESKIRVVVCV